MTKRSTIAATTSNPNQLSLAFDFEFAPSSMPEGASEEPQARLATVPTAADRAVPAVAQAPSNAKASAPMTGGTGDENRAVATAPDEYNPLSMVVPPGKDPAAVRHLSKQILGDAGSGTILDEILAGDIAKGTVFSDYLWEGMMDAHACYTQDTARELATSAEPSDHAPSQLARERQLRGRTQIAHLDDMMKHLKIYTLAQSSRNACITMFDTRRLNMLKAALAALKVNGDD